LEFRVLHLQLDLVDLKLMEKPLRIGLCPGGGGRFSHSCAQLLFSKAAQLSFIYFRDLFLSHAMIAVLLNPSLCSSGNVS
jgi:hypothetical protein